MDADRIEIAAVCCESLAPTIISQLKLDEGFVSKPTKDTLGNYFVGYGFDLSGGITKTEADMLLAHRVDRLLRVLPNLINGWDNLNSERKAVLVNMAYNLGVSGLLSFKKMLDAIAKNDYSTAADEMKDSKWYFQVGNRAKRLESIMRNGE